MKIETFCHKIEKSSLADVHFVELDLFIFQAGILCYHSEGQSHSADGVVHINTAESAVTFLFTVVIYLFYFIFMTGRIFKLNVHMRIII